MAFKPVSLLRRGPSFQLEVLLTQIRLCLGFKRVKPTRPCTKLPRVRPEINVSTADMERTESPTLKGNEDDGADDYST